MDPTTSLLFYPSHPSLSSSPVNNPQLRFLRQTTHNSVSSYSDQNITFPLTYLLRVSSKKKTQPKPISDEAKFKTRKSDEIEIIKHHTESDET